MLTSSTETKACQLVQLQIGKYTVAAVDTPGFDDDEDSDAVVLAKISRFLIAQHLLGIKLKGIVFLHDINIVRYSGSHTRFLETFCKLCGEDAFKNVALVTTMWEKENRGARLERDVAIQSDPGAALLAKGANVYQYDGTSDMAQTIVRLMLPKKGVVLRIQKELTKDDAELEKTTAGASLAAELDKKLEKRQKQITFLTEEIERAEASHDDEGKQQLEGQLRAERQKQLKQIKSRDALRPKIVEETDRSIGEADRERRARGERWKSRLQIFATILSPIIAVTVHFILPLAGVSLGA